MALGHEGWWDDARVADNLKAPISKAAARYLTAEKRRSGITADPVAHFHLSNGARMERLNWKGDLSSNGLAQSCGLMINYLYKLADIDGNHESYTSTGRIATSSSIRALTRG